MQGHTSVLASGPVAGVRLRNIWSPAPRHYMMSGKAAVNSGDETSHKVLYKARVRPIGRSYLSTPCIPLHGSQLNSVDTAADVDLCRSTCRIKGISSTEALGSISIMFRKLTGLALHASTDNLITGIKASPRTRWGAGMRQSLMVGCGVCGYPWSNRSWMRWFLGIAVCIIRGSPPLGSWPKVDSLTMLSY
jgi:hypothetical protein